MLYDGWTTEEGRYAFRCRREERVRLTFWQYKSDDTNSDGSEFINVTTEKEECLDTDIAFAHKPPKAPKPKRTKKISSKKEAGPKKEKEEVITKVKKDIKKKNRKKWEGVKK